MKDMENKVDIISMLKLRYSTLRKSEKKVADYILSNPEKIVHCSITNLAEYCKVSETSIIRLCKTMGYSGFQEMKINIALSIFEPQKQIHEEIEEGDSIGDIANKIMAANVKAIEDTVKMLDPAALEKAIDAISRTSRLEFYGMGGSGPVAMDAQHKFFKYGINCIAYNDPHMQAMSAATMKEGDVVVAISHSGSSRDLVESVKLAHDSGACTICITGGMKSPITKVSDISLMVVAKEQSFKPEPMSSRIVQLSIIDILSVGVAMRKSDVVIKNLEKTRNSIASKKY